MNDIEEKICLKNKYAESDQKIGFTCSCFDLLHPGHLLMLADAKKQCDVLIVGLQTDPTVDRPQKNKPVQTYRERKMMIQALRFVDETIKYTTEAELVLILELLQPNVRILGSDHRGKPFTGDHLSIPIYWHERNHQWSSTHFRDRIFQMELEKRLQITPKRNSRI